MWDDTSWGDVGIPEINKVRGFSTPNFNRMADEGIHFTRMYTEPSCTPSRAATMTGRLAVRTGMYAVGFPVEYAGLSGEEVTVAEVLSKAGYATAMYGKLHLGDIEEAWPHNQGFDETLFGIYNQIVSIWHPQAEAANAIMGLYPEVRGPDPYRVDDRFVPRGWVMTLEAKKGEPAYEVGGTTPKDFAFLDQESEKRLIDFIRRNVKAKKPFYAAYWPMLLGFNPIPEKRTLASALFPEAIENLDDYIGELRAELERLGIAENTLIVAMADNGPMSHNPPPGLAFVTDLQQAGWDADTRVAVPAGVAIDVAAVEPVHANRAVTALERTATGFTTVVLNAAETPRQPAEAARSDRLHAERHDTDPGPSVEGLELEGLRHEAPHHGRLEAPVGEEQVEPRHGHHPRSVGQRPGPVVGLPDQVVPADHGQMQAPVPGTPRRERSGTEVHGGPAIAPLEGATAAGAPAVRLGRRREQARREGDQK